MPNIFPINQIYFGLFLIVCIIPDYYNNYWGNIKLIIIDIYK